MPESVVGGGNTLKSARAQYRDALSFALDADRLPPIREHLEAEVDGLGIWVRTVLADPQSERLASAATGELLSHPDDHAWFYDHRTAGGYPVIIPGDPDAPISTIFDQMSPFDSLVVWALHRSAEKVSNVWLVMAGNQAEGDEPLTGLAELSLSENSPLKDLVRISVEQQLNAFAALAR